MAKKLSKILWHDTKVDGTGKPVLPSVATDDKGLNGLLPGELFMHVGKEKVSLWALSLSGEVVEVSGKTDEVDIDLSDYLLKSVWDSVFEIKTDVSGQKYLFGKLPMVTQYGVTMYGDNDELNVSDIYEGLPIDNVTLYWDNGVLKAKGGEGGGGGVADSIAWVNVYGKPSWVTDTKPIYNYSEIKNTPDLSVFVTGTALSNTLADYATLTYLTGELKKYVTIKYDQDIVGVKNFLNGIKISNMPIRKLQDDVIYIDANLVVRGGVTMYSTNEADIPTIKNEIGFAGYNGSVGLASFDSSQFVISANGTVSVKGGSAGLDTAQLKEYLDSNKYTTETWVKAQGYASASSLSSLQTKVDNFLEGSDTDTIINKWKELEVFLSGLSESDNLATILSTKWTTDNNLINQWNTAYGWGNHASVGYALKSYVDNNFVTLGTKQTITGEKNFTGGLRVNNSPSIYYDATNKYWKLEGDLLVTGGVTMYGTDEGDLPSILDSLPIASTSSAGIASFDSTYFSVNASGKVTLTSASSSVSILGSLQDVSSSVSGTTNNDVVLFKSANTSTWTTKLLSEIGGGGSIQRPLRWTGYDSGMWDGSSDGLIIIPTSLKNPNAITFTGAVSATYDGSSAVTVNIPTAGGNIDLSNYLPLTGGTLKGNISINNQSGNSQLTLYSTVGGWRFQNNANNYSNLELLYRDADANFTNIAQISKDGVINLYGSLSVASKSSGWRSGGIRIDGTTTYLPSLAFHIPNVGGWRLYLNASQKLMWENSSNGNTVTSREILHSGNYSSYALPLSGGTIYDSSDDTPLNVRSGDTETFIGFYNTSNVLLGYIGVDSSKQPTFHDTTNRRILTDANYSNYALPKTSYTASDVLAKIKTVDGSGSGLDADLLDGKQPSELSVAYSNKSNYLRTQYASSSDWYDSYVFYCKWGTDDILDLKVDSYSTRVDIAKKLNTARTIWGQSFDGTGNVDGDIGGSYFFISDSSINPYFKLVQGSTWYLQGSNGYLYLGAGSTKSLRIDSSGNCLSVGGITMYSDIRKKTKLQDVELSLSQIANAPLIQHYYNSDQEKTTHVGSIAQYWAEMNDWFCKLDNEGFYTMEIQNCALASAISIARHLEKYESKTDKKIRMLKKRVQELEDKLERLEGGNYGC